MLLILISHPIWSNQTILLLLLKIGANQRRLHRYLPYLLLYVGLALIGLAMTDQILIRLHWQVHTIWILLYLRILITLILIPHLMLANQVILLLSSLLLIDVLLQIVYLLLLLQKLKL